MAAVLLTGLTAYVWIATWADPGVTGPFAAVTSSSFVSSIAKVLGLDHPFSAPLFIVAIGLVTLSTAACAWDRTRSAARSFAPRGHAGDRVERILESHQCVVVVDAASFDRESAIDTAAGVLRRFGLTTRISDALLTGTRWPVGLVGSAVFHWALVGTFVFAGLGQLTRYEGYANVVRGQSTRDIAASYSADLTHGSLFRGWFSGLTLGVADVDLDHQVNGASRGPAALVTLSSGDREIKRQWVYPNSPLRYGSMLVHDAATVPVFLGSIRSDMSSDVRKVTIQFDIASRAPQEFSFVDDATGKKVDVTLVPLGGRRVDVAVNDGGSTRTRTAGVGERVELVAGQHLTVDSLTYAAQLHVVNDWSVPWLYAMFALGTLGVTAAIFSPVRAVSVAIVGGEGKNGAAPLALNVRYSSGRNDPAFPRLLEETLTGALTGQDATEREDRA